MRAGQSLVSPFRPRVGVQQYVLDEGPGRVSKNHQIIVLGSLKLPPSQRRFLPVDPVPGTGERRFPISVVPHLPDLLPGVPAGGAADLDRLADSGIPIGSRRLLPGPVRPDHRVALVLRGRIDAPLDPVQGPDHEVVEKQLMLARRDVDMGRRFGRKTRCSQTEEDQGEFRDTT